MKKRLHFEIVSRYEKKFEPATTGIPYKEGELYPADVPNLKLCDQNYSYPSQPRVMSLWKDGSVKWLLLHGLYNLPANLSADYFLSSNSESSVVPLDFDEIKIVDTKSGLVVSNGCISFELSAPGTRSVFKYLQTKEHLFKSSEIVGPYIYDREGKRYEIEIDDNGWAIEELGPVKAVFEAEGKHINKDKSWMNYELRITVWAGKPWVNIDYRFINMEDDPDVDSRKKMVLNNEQAGLKYDTNKPFQEITKICMEIKPDDSSDSVHHSIFTSSFNFHKEKAGAYSTIDNCIDAETIVKTGNEMFPEVLFSVYAGEWVNESYGVTAGIYQAYQNFPKALHTSKYGIKLDILPESGHPLKVYQGVARNQRIHLFFHEKDINDRMLVDQLLQFEMPALPVISVDDYMSSDVFNDYVDAHYNHKVERFLYRYIDSRAKGLGILNFGDGPEWEYIKQGRAGNDLIWINNEYDMPHNFMIMLSRSGDRRYFDYMKAAVEHWYDVDLCHYCQQPYQQGLLYTHSVNHVSGQAVPSHQWVEGFLDYYHMTGNSIGLTAAESISQGLLELMKLPLYHEAGLVEPREVGWAMRTFMAMYRETYDDMWLEACRPIVELYIAWADKQGSWMTPYPDNYLDRVPFMMHVGIEGMYQYYKYREDEQIKATLIKVVDDIIENCYVQRIGMFLNKTHPSIRFLNTNGMVLESLVIAFELTGNKKYLEIGKGMFQWMTEENLPPIYDFSKYVQDYYTVIYNCPAGPKRSAQSLLPLLHYYKVILEQGYFEKV